MRAPRWAEIKHNFVERFEACGGGRQALIGAAWLCLSQAHSPPHLRSSYHLLLLAQASPPTQPPRGLPSTMRADDIEGTRPGWRPHTLFAEQPRDPLHVADICPGPASKTSRACKGQQGDGRVLVRAASQQQTGSCSGGSAAAGMLPLSARPFQSDGPAVPEYGVAYTVDWRKQWSEAKLRQAEAARQAQAAADAAIAAAAAKAAAMAKTGGGAGSSGAAQGSGSGGSEAAGTVGLAGMMKSLRTYDRDGCGFVQASGIRASVVAVKHGLQRLAHSLALCYTAVHWPSRVPPQLTQLLLTPSAPQAGELAAALQQSRLGLSQGDVQHLVAAVGSSGGVEYRPFVSKLWGQLQQQGAVPAAPTAGPGQAVFAGSAQAGSQVAATGGPVPAGAAAPVHLPQFVVARQRRLQTNVALALAQQPEATAREAAELAGLPGYLPWKPKPAAQFGKRMAYDRHAELGTAPSTTFTFADGDPRASEVGVAVLHVDGRVEMDKRMVGTMHAKGMAAPCSPALYPAVTGSLTALRQVPFCAPFLCCRRPCSGRPARRCRSRQPCGGRTVPPSSTHSRP